MKQARDYRKYNVRLTSADWQRGSCRVIRSYTRAMIMGMIWSFTRVMILGMIWSYTRVMILGMIWSYTRVMILGMIWSYTRVMILGMIWDFNIFYINQTCIMNIVHYNIIGVNYYQGLRHPNNVN